MALNKQSQKDVQDTATYIEDTLKSVSANLGEVFKQAVESAFDGVDATVMTVATKDFTRAMAAAAKTSEDLVKNHYRISQGLTTSKNLEKQLQTIAERKLELERKYAYTKQLAEDIGKRMTKQQEKAFGDAQAALDLQERILEGDKQSLKDIEQKIGLTGKLIGSLSKIPGIGQFIKADEIDQAMRKAALDKNATKFTTMGVAAKMVGKQLYEGLLDPLTLITSIWNGFLRVNKASVELQRLTGQNETAMAGMNDRLASSVQFLETAAELTKQWGLSATLVFSPDQIAQIAEAKNLLGLSAEEAGRMGMLMKLTGKSADDVGQGIYDTVNAYNGANKAGIAHGVVLQDVLSASDSITASLGNSEKRIGAAATAARGLGLSLSEVDAIAGSLLNFEDSIAAELEAQLITGKNINLSKARELALNNDLEGVANELKKNGASAAEFAGMQRHEQESLAKALGMSRDQLAKSVLTQEAMNSMTAEQIAKARGVSLEQSKAMDVQEKMQLGLQKLAEAFAPVLEGIIPLVDVLLSIIQPIAKLVAVIAGNPIGKSILIAVVAVRLLGGGLFGAVKGMGSLAKGALDFVKNLNMKGVGDFFSGLKDKFGQLKGAFGEGFAQKVQEKAGEKAEGLADKALGAGKEVPEKTGGGMSSLTESIQKIKPTQILAGAAALVLVAGAVFIFAKAAQEFATVSWEDMAKAGVGLLGLVAALAAVGAIMMSGVGALAILAGAAAIVIMAGGLFILGKALQEVGEGMQMMEPALSLVASIGDKAMGLMTVGASLMGIAAGLREIASAGTGAIPVLDKINALAGGGNKSVGEAKGKEKEGSMAALEAKFDTLIEIVKQGTTITLDGAKISTSVNRNLPKIQVATS